MIFESNNLITLYIKRKLYNLLYINMQTKNTLNARLANVKNINCSALLTILHKTLWKMSSFSQKRSSSLDL